MNQFDLETLDNLFEIIGVDFSDLQLNYDDLATNVEEGTDFSQSYIYTKEAVHDLLASLNVFLTELEKATDEVPF